MNMYICPPHPRHNAHEPPHPTSLCEGPSLYPPSSPQPLTTWSLSLGEVANPWLGVLPTPVRVCVRAHTQILLFQTSQGFGEEATLLGSKSSCHDNYCRCSLPLSSAPSSVTPAQHSHTSQYWGKKPTFMVRIAQHLV